jgi:hypothetical protein
MNATTRPWGERCLTSAALVLGCVMPFGLATTAVARPAPPPTAPVGIWVIALEQPAQAVALSGIPLGAPGPFRFDGQSVYLHILCLHAWERPLGTEPNDCVQRWKARWKGNTLYVLPAGSDDWTALAVFVDGCFLVRGEKAVWTFRKADESKLSDLEVDLAKDRPLTCPWTACDPVQVWNPSR